MVDGRTDRRNFLTWMGAGVLSASTARRMAMAAPGRSPAPVWRKPTAGPLRQYPRNPRYFADSSGKPVYLTGSHTWATLQDIYVGEARPFDWPAFLKLMTDHQHNFLRLWHWEQAAWAPWTSEKIRFTPTVYLRTGPRTAVDGEPRFDLTQFNPSYFRRLRQRVEDCRERGIYVSIMLFQGWSHKKPRRDCDPWPGHPYNVKNNINGFDGDRNGDSIADLDDPAVRETQRAYIHKVIDTVNDLDNVLYEVINEGGNREWDWWVVNTVHQYERAKGAQHPVGITGAGTEREADLISSPADWVSIGNESGLLKTDPPHWDNVKVSLLDTDHIWGHGGTAAWVWKSMTRGHNPLLMDAWEPIPGALCIDENWGAQAGYPARDLNRREDPTWEPVRKALGHARSHALRMNLETAAPLDALASTRYCLASPGREYLVYLPEGDECTLDLSAAGELVCEWMHPVTGEITQGGKVKGGGSKPVRFCVPFLGPAVLFCHTTA